MFVCVCVFQIELSNSLWVSLVQVHLLLSLYPLVKFTRLLLLHLESKESLGNNNNNRLRLLFTIKLSFLSFYLSPCRPFCINDDLRSSERARKLASVIELKRVNERNLLTLAVGSVVVGGGGGCVVVVQVTYRLVFDSSKVRY